MTKVLTVALLMTSSLVGQTFAQTAQLPPQDLPQNGGAGARTGYIAPSGETVPNPGASESSGTTSLDRGVQREDQKIESSICKGC